MTKRKFYIFLIFVVISNWAYAQDNACDKYFDLMKKYLSERSSLTIPNGNTKYYFEEEMTSIFRDKVEYKDIKTNIKTVIAENRIHYITNELEMYHDLSDLVIISHATGMIFRSNSRVQELLRKNIQGTLILDSIFYAHIESFTCNNKSEGVIELKCLLDKDGIELYEIKQFNCVIDIEKGKLVRIKNFYSSNSKYKTLEINYFKMDLNSSVKIKKKAIDYILDRNGKLLSKYVGYNYINEKE